MSEKLQNIAKQIEENEELKAKLKAVVESGNSTTEYIAICKEYGIEIDESDLEQKSEVSDDELNAVTGGACIYIDSSTSKVEICGCAVGGGGNAVNIDGVRFPACGCVMGGGGVATVDRDVRVNGEMRHAGWPVWCVAVGVESLR